MLCGGSTFSKWPFFPLTFLLPFLVSNCIFLTIHLRVVSFVSIASRISALWCDCNGSIRRDPDSWLFPKLLLFPIFCRARRGIIQGGSAVEKKEIRSACEYSSSVLAGEEEEGRETKWIEHRPEIRECTFNKTIWVPIALSVMCTGRWRVGRMLALAAGEYEPYQSPPPGTNVITLQLLTRRVIRDTIGMHLLAYIRGLLVPVLTTSCLQRWWFFFHAFYGEAFMYWAFAFSG